MIDHFNPKSRRSREQRCHKGACGSSRLAQHIFTDVVNQSWEPHHSEAVAVERTHEVAVHNPFLETSVHEVEIEVLVGVGSGVDNAALYASQHALS